MTQPTLPPETPTPERDAAQIPGQDAPARRDFRHNLYKNIDISPRALDLFILAIGALLVVSMIFALR